MKQFLLLVLPVIFFSSALAAENPMSWVDGINDCGVLKYRGEYFITGNWLAGDMFSSEDLVTWTNRHHIFSWNNTWHITQRPQNPDLDIHGTDIRYHNGTFHLYPHLESSGITHAVSDRIEGPYQEPFDAPFAQNIDGNLFQDQDGKWYFHVTRFNNGNEIWGQAMKDPWTLEGNLLSLFGPRANSWERMDGRINEGPFVIAYRDRYYLLYNANSTGDYEFGNYALGCCEAGGPLAFSATGKYLDPVLDSATQQFNQRVANVGQPWIVRGPNGFEWLLGYFAIYTPNGLGGRFQAVDRILFFNRQMFVDGPTTFLTEGTHPGPAMPQYRGLFNDPSPSSLSDDWLIQEGDWTIQEGELWQNAISSAGCLAHLKRSPATDYLFETSLRFADFSNGRAGVMAYYGDEENWLAVCLHPAAHQLNILTMNQGALQTQSTPLMEGFRFDVLHELRIEKNGSLFQVNLDGIPAPGGFQWINTAFSGAGSVALYCENARAGYDGICYTLGWDEWDSHFQGWGMAAAGTSESGSWSVSSEGIQQSSSVEEGRIFKGDLLPEYDFSVEAFIPSGLTGNQRVGFYPVYMDAHNWLKAEIDANRQLRISGFQAAQELPLLEIPLRSRVLLPTADVQAQTWHYTTTQPAQGWEQPGFDDSSWNQNASSGFGFQGLIASVPSYLRRTRWNTTDIWLRKKFVLNEPSTPYTQFRVQFKQGAEIYLNGILAATLPERPNLGNSTSFYWYVDINGDARLSLHPGENTLAVHAQNSDTSSFNGSGFIDVGIINPKVRVENTRFHLRTIKSLERVVLQVDGQELASLPYAFPSSQVGLTSFGTTPVFNGSQFHAFTSDHRTLPEGWADYDVGTITRPGVSRYESGAFTLRADGQGFGNTQDHFHSTYRILEKDFSISCRVDFLNPTGPSTRSGLTVRTSGSSGSPHVSLLTTAAGEVWLVNRAEENGGSTIERIAADGLSLPIYLKLEREKESIRAYYSSNGNQWTDCGTRSLVLDNPVPVGMVTTSGEPLKRTVTRFSQVNLIEEESPPSTMQVH